MILIGMVLIIGVFVKDHRNRKQRNSFFDRYPASDLRMNPYKIGVVYRVVGLREETIIAVRIWDAGRPVQSNLELSFQDDELIPFDRYRLT